MGLEKKAFSEAGLSTTSLKTFIITNKQLVEN